MKNIETNYSIKVSKKDQTDQMMGAAFTKLKHGSSDVESSKTEKQTPTKSADVDMNVSKFSPLRSFPPNGVQFTYEKAKMKAMVLSEKRMLKKLENQSKTFEQHLSGKRKRKSLNDGELSRSHEKSTHSDSEHKRKRRRTNSLRKLKASDIRTHGFDARDIIIANRAQRLENKRSPDPPAGQRCILDFRGFEKINSINEDRGKSTEKHKQGLCGDSRNKLVSSTDVSSAKCFDQNLNHITNNIKSENLKELFQKKVKEVNEASPLKGKMSAFEISVLKGKQNVERRKSIESAALRSSPRTNTNVPKPNYQEKDKVRSRLSLDHRMEQNSVGKKNESRGRKRTRSVDVAKMCSPSSVENKIFKPVPKRRTTLMSRRNVNLKRNSRVVNYRLNGSPKLKQLPARLSLDSLSGTKDKHQGSAFTVLHKHHSTSKLSGTSAALHASSPSHSSPAGTHSPRSKTQSRPKTLPGISCTGPGQSDSLEDHCCTKAEKTESMCKSNSRRNLEETVNMLRNQMGQKPKKFSLSPARSDSRTSRRSSRSSTPNVSPIKSEILTPSTTPCSSRSKSPCTVPSGLGGRGRGGDKKTKNYLFAKHDKVLAQWHDGLFYLGKILKIDEKNQKCLLRYEDNSEYWSLFKDIHRDLKEEEMICCICLSDVSEPPNEIVLCEICLQGFHQQCHIPNISSGKIVDPDEPWYCRKCVFLRASQNNTENGVNWDEELSRVKLTLPYDLDSLTWDQQHKNNTQQLYCYCGGPGIWFQNMLQCCRCKQWFHQACMQCREHPLLYADSFYLFVCSPCNSGSEYIKRLDVDWPDLVHISLFNLAMQFYRKYFDLHSELMPWMSVHWDQLQMPKYNDLTETERELEVVNALESNPARFISASEVRKRQALWGLRVRVPPPRITITLPYKGQITDEVMNKLKIKGRRSKVFTPVECKSPVNKITYSPLHPSGRVRKKLDAGALKQAKSENEKTEPMLAPKQQHLSFLDRICSPDEQFSAQKHPFMTEVEEMERNAELERREKVWDKFLTLYGCSDEIESNVSVEDFVRDEPPVLEKVEPVVPVITCNGTPPMPEIQDKKAHVKSVPKLEKTSEKKVDRRPSRRSTQRQSTPIEQNTDGSKSDEFTVKHIKSVAGGNFYCVYSQAGYGKGFSVMGKRVNGAGQVEYMVKWD